MMHVKSISRFQIGMSGWQYREMVGSFYPETLPNADKLRYYANHFSTVEVNSTFYHFSRLTTYQKWTEQTPDDFLISVKANRAFTHFNPLQDPDDRLVEFIETASQGLASKLGPILFQFPPSLDRDLSLFKKFVAKLPEDKKYVFEFRHPSWWVKPVADFMTKRNICLCVYDLRQFQSPLITTADFAYVRLHGPLKQPYRGAYSEEALKIWAKQARDWQGEGRDVFIYFDNTMTGDAVWNAIRLMELLAKNVEKGRAA